MEELLVKLMILSAITTMGLTLSKKDIREVEKKSLEVTKINWKPISIFPDEAKRFH